MSDDKTPDMLRLQVRDMRDEPPPIDRLRMKFVNWWADKYGISLDELRLTSREVRDIAFEAFSIGAVKAAMQRSDEDEALDLLAGMVGDDEHIDPVSLSMMGDPVRRAAFEGYANTQSGHYDRMNAAITAALEASEQRHAKELEWFKQQVVSLNANLARTLQRLEEAETEIFHRRSAMLGRP